MSKEIKLSVIIPAYNCEDTIIACIESIIKTNLSYEIIVINDNSTDKTVEKLKCFINSNVPIRIINNDDNRGAGFSRNIGVTEASADIICFLDSDDTVSEGYIDYMYQSMIDNNSDVVVCDICSISSKIINNSFEFKDLFDLIKKPFVASPCGKLFKKELVKKHPFPIGIINEDIASVIPILIDANKISYTNTVKYNYIKHNDSVQNSVFTEKKFDVFKAFEIVQNRIKNCTFKKEIEEILVYNQIILLLIYRIVEIDKFVTRGKFIKIFSDKLMGNNINLRGNKYFEEYIQDKGKQNILFYKGLVFLIDKKLIWIANIWIHIYNILRKTRNKMSVIKKDITAYDLEKAAIHQKNLKKDKYRISVVIPNYNYSDFLFDRIYSILIQKKKIYELIILDDNSLDNSIEVIENIKSIISPYINVKVEYNKENSGCVFKQWQKGFSLSEGEYVWIAEADDYCKNSFLVDIFDIIGRNDDIVLAYTDTNYINSNGNVINRRVKRLIDLSNTGHWEKSYINDGKNEISNYGYLNCTIANVSSVVFKKGDYKKYFENTTKYKQVGDWFFYLQIMCLGNIAFVNKKDNYYRIHGSNQTSTTKKMDYINEISGVYSWIIDEFDLSKDKRLNMNERLEYLRKVWGEN